MTSPVRADVVVIGAGLVGCATAYELAKRGVDVLVLERAWIGAGSSTRGMGGIRQQFADEIDVRLVQESLPTWERFADEVGGEAHFAQRGYLFLAETEAGLAELESLVAPLRSFGADVRMVDRAEIAELVPGIRADDLLGGRFCAQDGYGDPSVALRGFADGARRHGGRILEQQGAIGIVARDGRVAGVDTTETHVVAAQVLVACGAWSADILATCAVQVPIWPYRRQLARAADFPQLARIPMTIEWESGLHFRAKEMDQLFAMPNLARDGSVEKAPTAPGPAAPMMPDPRALAWTQERAARRHPAFAGLRFAEAWACYYEMTPDDHPILGAVPEVEGLYLAAGFSGHGFMQSPATGRCMAELLTEGRAQTVDIGPLGIERFRDGVSRFKASVL